MLLLVVGFQFAATSSFNVNGKCFVLSFFQVMQVMKLFNHFSTNCADVICVMYAMKTILHQFIDLISKVYSNMCAVQQLKVNIVAM